MMLLDARWIEWQRPLLAIVAGDRLTSVSEGGPIEGIERRLAVSRLVHEPVHRESTIHGA